MENCGGEGDEMNVYDNCPVITTENFTLRLIRESDSQALYDCYHDRAAVDVMNDDNCDFGFYVESQEKMLDTVRYWVEFYEKQCFVRFAIVDRATGKAVGTIEGFGGETGVLRVDIASALEKAGYLSQLFRFAAEHFRELFGNEYLVTKAVGAAAERRKALEDQGWEFIDTFREYRDYYRIRL